MHVDHAPEMPLARRVRTQKCMLQWSVEKQHASERLGLKVPHNSG